MLSKKVKPVLATLAIAASGAIASSSIYRHLAVDKVAVASFYIQLDKQSSSASKQLQKSRNYLTSFFEKDLPFYFAGADGKTTRRALTNCTFHKEDLNHIDYRCQARANTSSSENLAHGTAYLYRISINGYPRNETKLLARLKANQTEELTSRADKKGFFDPINHPETGDPTLQELTVPVNIYESINPGQLNGEQATGQKISALNIALGSLVAGIVLAIISRSHKRKTFTISAALIITGYLLAEQLSRAMYWNPLPRNSLLANSALLEIFENTRLKVLYKSFSSGKTGESLVDSTWRKGHLENYGHQESTFDRVNNFNKDDNGISYSSTCTSRDPNKLDVLALGASVAEGAHASSVPKTWWNLSAENLTLKVQENVCFGVLAKGGIKSDRELELLDEFLSKYTSPKALVIVHGQNDILNRTLNLDSKAPGARQDYRQTGAASTDQLIAYSEAIRALATKNNISVYEAIPPSAIDKASLTQSEKAILVGYAGSKLYDWSLPRRILNHWFNEASTRLKLSDLLNEGYTFLDLRDIFNSTATTLFADIWHFGDKGHEIFAEHITAALHSQFHKNARAQSKSIKN